MGAATFTAHLCPLSLLHRGGNMSSCPYSHLGETFPLCQMTEWSIYSVWMHLYCPEIQFLVLWPVYLRWLIHPQKQSGWCFDTVIQKGSFGQRCWILQNYSHPQAFICSFRAFKYSRWAFWVFAFPRIAFLQDLKKSKLLNLALWKKKHK